MEVFIWARCWHPSLARQSCMPQVKPTDINDTLVILFTQFLNLCKDGRMIWGVRLPPEVCKMASSLLDFH